MAAKNAEDRAKSLVRLAVTGGNLYFQAILSKNIYIFSTHFLVAKYAFDNKVSLHTAS